MLNRFEYPTPAASEIDPEERLLQADRARNGGRRDMRRVQNNVQEKANRSNWE